MDTSRAAQTLSRTACRARRHRRRQDEASARSGAWSRRYPSTGVRRSTPPTRTSSCGPISTSGHGEHHRLPGAALPQCWTTTMPNSGSAWERIDPDAVLVVVGDVAMGAMPCATQRGNACVGRPRRHKHLVIGNHDVTGSGRGANARIRLGLVGDDVPGRPAPSVDALPAGAQVPERCVNIHGHEHGEGPREGHRTST